MSARRALRRISQWSLMKHNPSSSLSFQLKSPARRAFRCLAEYLDGWPYRIAHLHHTSRTGICTIVRERCEWWLYNDIFVEGEYDEGIVTALLTADTSRPFIAVDLGANVGFFALRLIDKVLRSDRNLNVIVTAVEGSPSVFRELRARMTAQPEFPNVRVHLLHGLVGERTGTGWIGESRMHIANSITGVRAVRRSEVPFVDVVAAMEDNPRIDLLKCDVEGAEELFLESSGEILKKLSVGIFEFHKKLCDVGRCVEMIRSYGMNIRIVRDMPDYQVAICARN